MQSDFSFVELRMIQNECAKSSAATIADLLERPVDEVREVMNAFAKANHIITYDDRLELEEKKVQKKENERKQKYRKAKRLSEQKKAEERQRKMLLIQQERERKQRKTGPVFKTRKIDYNTLTAVRIDHKTVIYAKPGQDINELKKRFSNTYRSVSGDKKSA